MQYNSQVTQKQLTNCDWLSFSTIMNLDEYELATEPRFYCPQGYILKHYSGTNLYKNRSILYTEQGDKVLTLLYNPHSRIINKYSLFVEVANSLLYGDFDYILDLLQYLHTNTWQSLSRFDIATDFNPTAHQSAVINELQAGTAYVQGKREGSMFHRYQQGSTVDRVAHCISWGSKYSDVKFKLYNKTMEITEVDDKGRTWCTKPYIQSKWLAHGLDPKNVWRLEVSIMGAASYVWHGQKLGWAVTDPCEFTELFYDLYTTRFRIRKNQGHQYKKYDRLIDFLEVPTDIDKERIKKAEPIAPQHHTDHAATIRNLMKELDRDEVKCNPRISQSLLTTLECVINTAHLEAYFLRAMGKGFDEWLTEYLQDCAT